MLPGVHAENRLHINSAGGQTPRVRRVRAHRAGILVSLRRRVLLMGGHVDRLSSRVGSRVRRAGVVGAEDVDQSFSLQVLCKPHESGTEHGISCGQKVEFQRLDRRAGVDDILFELFGDLGFMWGLIDFRCVSITNPEHKKAAIRILTKELKKKWLL